jgi:CTP synthase (UTP-ammonia lyase)
MAHNEIVLIGERDPSIPAHAGIEASISLFREQVNPRFSFRWISTAEMDGENLASLLGSARGMWCTPGSPYKSTDGALQAIRFARENGIAFLGTCGGFQHALMEFSRNVLGRNADHQEMNAGAHDPLIVKLSCSLMGAKAKVIAIPGTSLAKMLGSDESVEEFNCNYGLAPTLEPIFAGSDLKFVAYDEAHQVRAFQLSNHPFFIGTLFQPERSALRGTLHPLVGAFFQYVSSLIP